MPTLESPDNQTCQEADCARPAGDENEIYAELVAGLGEAIVSGMVPGTSLSFTAKKDALGDPQVSVVKQL